MNVSVNWDNVDSSRWAENRIEAEADRLGRILPESSTLHLRVGHEGQKYCTKLHVHALGKDWVTSGDGDNLWEGIEAAFKKVLRKLEEFKTVQKNRIHRTARVRRPAYAMARIND